MSRSGMGKLRPATTFSAARKKPQSKCSPLSLLSIAVISKKVITFNQCPKFEIILFLGREKRF